MYQNVQGTAQKFDMRFVRGADCYTSLLAQFIFWMGQPAAHLHQGCSPCNLFCFRNPSRPSGESGRACHRFKIGKKECGESLKIFQSKVQLSFIIIMVTYVLRPLLLFGQEVA